MCINCDSLRSVEKHAELNCFVSHHNPHVILGQESRLSQDISSCEVFPKEFRAFCRDRVMGSVAVFILVREDFSHVVNAFPDHNKDCESVLANLNSQCKTIEHSYFL